MNIKLMKSTHFTGQSNCDTSYPSVSEKFSHQDGRDHVCHEASLWAGCWHRGSQVHVLASCHPVQQPHSWSWVRSRSILRNHIMSSRSAAGSGGQTRCHPRQTWEVEGRCWGLQENIRPTCSMWLQQHFITSKIILRIAKNKFVANAFTNNKTRLWCSIISQLSFPSIDKTDSTEQRLEKLRTSIQIVEAIFKEKPRSSNQSRTVAAKTALVWFNWLLLFYLLLFTMNEWFYLSLSLTY